MGTCMHYEPADFFYELSRFPGAKIFTRSYSLDQISGLVYMFYGDGDIYYLDRLFTTEEKYAALDSVSFYDFHQELYRRIMLDERIRQENGEKINELDEVFLLADNGSVALDSSTSYNIGYLFVESLYKAFELDKVFNELKEKYNCSYDLNYIVSYIIYSKILNPKAATAIEEAKFFKGFKPWSLQEEMDAISILSKENAYIQQHLYDKYNELFKRDTDTLYHDVMDVFTLGSNIVGKLNILCDTDMIPMCYRNTLTKLHPTKLEQEILDTYPCHTFVSGLNSKKSIKADTYINYHRLEDLDETIRQEVLKDEGWISSPHGSIQYKKFDDGKMAFQSNELVQYLNDAQINNYKMRYKSQYVGYYYVDTNIDDVEQICIVAERIWKIKEALENIPVNSLFVKDLRNPDFYDAFYLISFVCYVILSVLRKQLRSVLNKKYELNEIAQGLMNMKVSESKEYGIIPVNQMTPLISDLLVLFYQSENTNSDLLNYYK